MKTVHVLTNCSYDLSDLSDTCLKQSFGVRGGYPGKENRQISGAGYTISSTCFIKYTEFNVKAAPTVIFMS